MKNPKNNESNEVIELDSIIGKNLEYFRKIRGFTQEQVANAINKKRSFISKIETGFQSLKASDLKRISEHMSIPTEEFYIDNIQEKYRKDISILESNSREQEERISEPDFNFKKLSNIILFLIEKTSTLNFQSAKHLQNLLFISDFDFYELFEEHLSSEIYIKHDFGVLGKHFFEVIDYLVEKKYIYHLNFDKTFKYIILKEPNKSLISLNEANVIESVINRFGKFSERDLNEKIKSDVPFQGTDLNNFIDYEFAFYRDNQFSVRTYED